MEKKEKYILGFLISLLFISLSIDLYTAFRLPIAKISETNPIYLMTGGSIYPLLIMSILVIVIIYYGISRKISFHAIHLFVLFTFFISFLHFLGAYSNYIGSTEYQENPEQYIEQHQNDTNEEKIFYYFTFIVLVTLPLIISYVSFVISYSLYRLRQPEREKKLEEIYNLSKEIFEE